MGRVVFVEDDATIRKLVQVALRSTPHEVHFAVNGREGLDLIERVRPDVIFTDVAMPEMDGLQLADALHARADLASIPIVFVTASLQRDQIERYFAHGARSYLAKPFSPAELRDQVDRMVAGS